MDVHPPKNGINVLIHTHVGQPQKLGPGNGRSRNPGLCQYIPDTFLPEVVHSHPR